MERSPLRSGCSSRSPDRTRDNRPSRSLLQESVDEFDAFRVFRDGVPLKADGVVGPGQLGPDGAEGETAGGLPGRERRVDVQHTLHVVAEPRVEPSKSIRLERTVQGEVV